jgi:hypothetical protein
MKLLISGVVPLLAAACVLAATDWNWSYRPARTQYETYAGSLGEPAAPVANDTKIAFEVSGEAAQRMFNAMAPDKTDICTASAGTRFRSRDDDKIVCTRSSQGQYSCQFGFDLKTGKSIGGSVC